MSADRAVRGWRGHFVLLAVLALATGASWVAVVPPFEGPDELFFYTRARDFAAHPERGEAIFYRLCAPIVRWLAPGAEPAAPEYNPAFQFVSNRRGEVNRFAHDRRVAPREHVRALYTIRVVVVVLSAATVLAIYAIARLSLGSAALALLVAGISMWIPQFSFISAVAHPEAVTRLVGAVATLIVVARATGRLSSTAGWLLALPCVAIAPLADRQAFFLVPFLAIGLVAAEPIWSRRAVSALLCLAAGATAVWLIASVSEFDTNLGPWKALLRNPLWPFSANGAYGSTPPDAAYYVYEFVPKLFMGFWGWMGQPSILLPAWMYAGLAALTLIASIGLVLRLGSPRAGLEEAGRLRARRLMAVGILLMCIPIVYGPAIAGRNLWYGRWLFPMLGPLIAGLVVGVSAFAESVGRNPRRAAVWLGAAVAAAWLAWLTAPGDALRAAILSHHYGDRARLIASCRDLLIALAAVAAAIGIGARVSLPRTPRLPVVWFAAAGLANALLVAVFLRPLYAPLVPEEYAALVSDYLAEGDTQRAANTYASAVKSFPNARVVSDLADAAPRLLLGGDSAASRARLWEWLARGHRLNDRDALLMLAHEAAAGGGNGSWRHAGAVDALIADAERESDLAEPASLLRLAVDGELVRGDPSELPIESSYGRRFGAGTPMRNGEAILDGYTVHPRGSRGTQLIVYFRPRADGANRRLWLHAYPNGTPPFLDLTPTIPPVWRPGALAWAVYELPPGRFGVYLGLWVGSDIGDATLLGAIP